MKITPDSHLDHGLTDGHFTYILQNYGHVNGFFISTSDLPTELPELLCELYGPLMGDQPVAEDRVQYMIRGVRKGASRVIDAPPRPTRKLTVVAGPHGNEPCVLYTAFGGPPGLREPWDPALDTIEAVQEARKFWAEHALVGRPAGWVRSDEHVTAFLQRINTTLENETQPYALVLKVVEHELRHGVREEWPGKRQK